MLENKWGAEPFPDAPKVQELIPDLINEPIVASLFESLADPSADPSECIVPPPRLSLTEGEVESENDGWGSKNTITATFYSHKNRVEDLIQKVSVELNIAHSRKYDVVQAELTAALILETQRELSEFLADAELISKERKAEVERIEAEQYFHYKDSQETKTTDVALNRMVSKDKLVLSAKKEQYEAESDFSKYKNLFGMLKDAHVFFRGLAKGKNDWT